MFLNRVKFVFIFLVCVNIRGVFSEDLYNRKVDSLKILLNEAKEYFKEHTVSQICHELLSNPKWKRDNDLFFILDSDGICFLMGDNKNFVWEDRSDSRDNVGIRLLDRIFKGPGGSINDLSSVIYNFNNSPINLLCNKVKKDEKEYAICVGFYPFKPEYQLVGLVSSAVALMGTLGLEEVFALVNNSSGPLIRGDISVFIIQDDGKIVADGDKYPLVGFNIFQDKHIFGDEVANKFKSIFNGFLDFSWITYNYNNAFTRAFCRKYVDAETQKAYLVCAAYYPDLNSEEVYELVQRAATYLKTAGLDVAANNFNSYATDFVVGNSKISVYNFNGLCFANAADTSFVGHNVLDRISSDGHFYMREIIEEVKKFGRSWSKKIDRNGYKLVYSERVNLPSGTYIVSSGYWPHSRKLLAENMVSRAVNEFKKLSIYDALCELNKADSDYLYGDLYIQIFDENGIFLSDGPYGKDKIWHKMDLKNNYGQSVIDLIQATAASGGGWVNYVKDKTKFSFYSYQVPLVLGEKSRFLTVVVGFEE